MGLADQVFRALLFFAAVLGGFAAEAWFSTANAVRDEIQRKADALYLGKILERLMHAARITGGVIVLLILAALVSLDLI